MFPHTLPPVLPKKAGKDKLSKMTEAELVTFLYYIFRGHYPTTKQVTEMLSILDEVQDNV